MDLSLSNSLVGGGSMNPDGLSLDLNFAADKTLTARRGPTPVFSRGSSGTFVNANGLIVGKTTATTTSSITPSSQAISSQVSVTVPSGSVAGWVVGQPISLIVDTDGQDDPDTTELWLLGNITSIAGGTLTFEVTSRTAQAGSASSWTLGYRGPRFDHDPVTLASKGLLIEEGRTNLFIQSSDFNATDWTKSGCTISQNTSLTLSPSGQNDADQIIETSASSTHQLNSSAMPTSAAHTVSVFAKMNGRRWIVLRASGVDTFFDLQNGTFVNTSQNPTITSFGNGWYRCTVQSSSATQTFFRMSNDGTSVSYPGDGASGVFLWGAQLEAGAFPTSYIPTTIVTAARSADVCTITSSAFNSFYNQSEGTFLSKTQLFSIGNDYNASYWNVFSGTSYMRISVFGQTSTVENSYLQNNDSTLNSTVPSQLSRISRAAGAYQLNNARLVKNGTLGVLDTIFTPYSNLISLTIMSQASGTMESLRYYRKRLPDAKLQTLTV